ncbi:MAG: hypothetical protein H6722_02540 [Sandaracinus sp.]|nr:hypothetical protein [Sandaracinus sp.]
MIELRRAGWIVGWLLVACASGTEPSTTRRDASATRLDGGPTCTDDVVCTTGCESEGRVRCEDGDAFCELPDESCNGRDDDCDGLVDEAIAPRTCSSACGGGTITCEDGAFTACSGGSARPETCDGTDEDCDGAIDEALTRGCANACGSGVERCAAGVFAGCDAPTPSEETCDGVDQDCDGTVDEGLSRACNSACGAGAETCRAGAWVDCDARMPVAESCNLADDDCDGTADEGFQATIHDPVPMAELTAAQPPCDGPNGGVNVCMSAARRWCAARGCHPGGGAGHLQATPTGARVVCFGARADQHTVSFTDVSSASSIAVTTSNVHTRVAQSAVNRYCRSRGFGAGIGPTEHSDVQMTVTCLPADVGFAQSIATTELTSRGCDPNSNPNTLGCASAADLVCRGRGHQSGFGPVEWNPSEAAVVCFP